MKPRHLHVSSSLLIVLVMTTVVWLNAGDLNPPVGPVAPTHKTLTEVEPRRAINATNTPGDANSVFRISAPGSYYLTGNVSGVSGKSGIEIGSSNVALDLMGFDVIGVVGATNGVIVDSDAFENVRVVNGRVRGWPDIGVYLGFNNRDSVGMDLASVGNGTGFEGGNTFHRCVARNNDGAGFSGMRRLLDCAAIDNAAFGMILGLDGVISGCLVEGNMGDGIFVSSGATISHCVAWGNFGYGVFAGSNVNIDNIVVHTNTMGGLLLSVDCHVSHCTISGNFNHGVEAYDNLTISHSTVSDNGGDGIYPNSGTITACTVNNNLFNGIEVFVGDALITGCTANYNLGSGIVVPSGCRVEGNTCGNNGSFAGGVYGAGILGIGENCRIDSNHVAVNDSGLDVNVPANRNVIIRNSARGNGVEYLLDPGNDIGPIGTAATATSPWANLDF